MNNKRNFYIFWLIIIFSISLKADVPPSFGEIRVNPPLVFELENDVSDYEFFLESPIDIEKIEVKKGETTTIDSSNRGGAKKFANLLAIPKSELDKIKFDNSESSKKELKRLIDNKGINGTVLLVKHSFQEDISISEKANWTYPVYKIERDGNSLKSSKKTDDSKKISLAEEKKLNEGKFQIVIIIVGIMMTLTIITFGIVVVRKVLKKG